MPLERLFERLLLRPADIKPTRDDFEVVGVFNPGAVRALDEVILLVRVAEAPREHRPGHIGLPRWNHHGEQIVDWVRNEEVEIVDPRVVRRKADGLVRLTFTSHLRVVRCGDGRSVREITDLRFLPELDLEEYGVEDPRITPLYGRFYFTYVAVSRHGAATALASTTDFQDFSRQGLIFCCENKDVVLFPEWIAGAHVALHRPNPATPFCRPEMWVAWSQDIIHWGHHSLLRNGGCSDWETGRVGAGTPPVRFPGGWLEIFHGSAHTTTPGAVGKYSAGALLLHAENPAQVLRRTTWPIFEPIADFERKGFVPDVVFPTGIVETKDTILVYYGAADTCTAVVEFSKEELMGAMVQV
jgi:predicted GH43/DUF377 family glycosyl hydrolase